MKYDYFKRAKNGKGYKITKTREGYWVALFRPGQVTAFDGWNNALRRHAKGDGEAYLNDEERV
jgi:hypothetical protein